MSRSKRSEVTSAIVAANSLSAAVQVGITTPSRPSGWRGRLRGGGTAPRPRRGWRLQRVGVGPRSTSRPRIREQVRAAAGVGATRTRRSTLRRRRPTGCRPPAGRRRRRGRTGGRRGRRRSRTAGLRRALSRGRRASKGAWTDAIAARPSRSGQTSTRASPKAALVSEDAGQVRVDAAPDVGGQSPAWQTRRRGRPRSGRRGRKRRPGLDAHARRPCSTGHPGRTRLSYSS